MAAAKSPFWHSSEPKRALSMARASSAGPGVHGSGESCAVVVARIVIQGSHGRGGLSAGWRGTWSVVLQSSTLVRRSLLLDKVVRLTEVILRILLQNLLERHLRLRPVIRVEQAHRVVVPRVEVGALVERGLEDRRGLGPAFKLTEVVAEERIDLEVFFRRGRRW